MGKPAVPHISHRFRFARFCGVFAYWLGWPFWYVVLHNTKRVRIVMLCDQYVLLERSFIGSGAWGLPGGGMHARETAPAAAQRELAEETGLALPETMFLPLGEATVVDAGISYQAQYVYGELASGMMDRLAPHAEVAELAWVPLSALTHQRVLPSVTRGLDLWESQ